MKHRFNKKGYLFLHPDIKFLKYFPLLHYILIGRRKGYGRGWPSSKVFFSEGYKFLYPDVASSGVDPWHHYVLAGSAEGRDNGLHPPKDKFFPEGYKFLYPDVASSGVDPWHHYVLAGSAEGRDNGLHPPKDIFFAEGYNLIYRDVSSQGIDAWHHYVLYGVKEGRLDGRTPPSNLFSSDGFKLNNPHYRPKSDSEWADFARFGFRTGMDNGLEPKIKKFNSYDYLYLNPDVVNAKLDAWSHYSHSGWREHRACCCFFKEMSESKKRLPCVLLVAHELSVTGAPLSLKGIANILLTQGYSVEIWSFPRLLAPELYDDIDVTVKFIPSDINSIQNLLENILKFKFIICNTIVTGKFAEFCSNNKIKHLWIIRESMSIPDSMQAIGLYGEIFRKDNKNIYCDSEYVNDLIYKFYNVRVNILNNFVIDKGYQTPVEDDVLTISVVGSIEERKGQDLAILALNSISNSVSPKKWLLQIIGKNVDLDAENTAYLQKLKQISANYQNIVFTGLLTGDRKLSAFKKTDVFLIPSRDEASSRIVLEAGMTGRMIVCSENVGAKYLVDASDGFVFENGNLVKLANILKQIFNLSMEEIVRMGKAARQKYLFTSTDEIYKKNLLKIFKEHEFI